MAGVQFNISLPEEVGKSIVEEARRRDCAPTAFLRELLWQATDGFQNFAIQTRAPLPRGRGMGLRLDVRSLPSQDTLMVTIREEVRRQLVEAGVVSETDAPVPSADDDEWADPLWGNAE